MKKEIRINLIKSFKQILNHLPDNFDDLISNEILTINFEICSSNELDGLNECIEKFNIELNQTTNSTNSTDFIIEDLYRTRTFFKNNKKIKTTSIDFDDL